MASWSSKYYHQWHRPDQYSGKVAKTSTRRMQERVKELQRCTSITSGARLRTALIPRALIPRSLIPRSLIPRSLIPRSLIPRSLIPRSLIPRALIDDENFRCKCTNVFNKFKIPQLQNRRQTVPHTFGNFRNFIRARYLVEEPLPRHRDHQRIPNRVWS